MGAVRAHSRLGAPPPHGTRMRRSCRCSVCDLKPAVAAKHNEPLAPELAAGIARVKSVKQAEG